MQEEIVELFFCPRCNGDIEIIKRVELIKQNNIMFLNSGLLACKECNSLYPVVDRIPRMLREERLSSREKKITKDYENLSFKEPKVLVKSEINENEKHKIIEKLVKEKLHEDERYRNTIENLMKESPQFESREAKKVKKIVEHQIEYRVYQTEKKERFVNTCIPYLTDKPQVIADIGGGQGGTISCFSKYFTPRISLLIDLDISWATIALIRDPTVNVIRADIANLPFKNQGIDLLITTSVLEHISAWEKATEEMARISKNAFICYGPNKWSLYDLGHVNAPLVTILPVKIGAGVAYLYHKFILKTGYSYRILKKEIEGTYFIPRSKVMKILKKYGIVKNVFPEFIYHSVMSDSYFDAGRIKSFLKSHPRLRKFSSKFLVRLGLEPDFYLFFRNN